ncbi:MAG: DUF418 domain-containing protein [Bacteroidota bacterium]|nr:DUF418 domain-containing protein [Bacteroidota bacterium]
MNITYKPVVFSKRILSLDVLRGVAVLGILIMNIQSFAMIGAAYINPTAFGELSGINKLVWIFSHMFANEKFMTIFSILFGAGMLLFISSANEKGEKSGKLHYRRMFWLLLFGMLHAYLVWYGDILVAYSLCGMLLYLFRNKKPETLLIFSTLFFVIPVLLNLFTFYSIKHWPQDVYNENMASWLPSTAQISAETANMKAGWLDQMGERAKNSFFMQTFLFFWLMFWRATSMMLLGMALFKWGVLSASRSNNFYIKMTLIGLSLGYLITGAGVFENFKVGWEMDFSMFIGTIYSYVGSVSIALGYIGLVMLMVKSIKFKSLKIHLALVGKMAFTNYIFMSLFCMFIFFGNGLGLFGKIERMGQLLIVFGIWAILIVFSKIWLSKFRIGPLEKLWRRLTYGRITKDPVEISEKHASPVQG